ncbi:hypothetical protein ACFRK5_30685 [Streptomyces niveus]|uniref:hypothetical protein n=1 Tax=Streptomyces niveus TaxID=193462 RepID=UPI0036957C30
MIPTTTKTAVGMVLALEFRGVGDTADFGFLGREGRTVGLTRVDPLVHHIGGLRSLAEQAELIAGQLPQPPDLVLSYCGTSAIALHVAAHTDAPSLLVDPYPITAEDMHRDVRNLCRSMNIDPALLGAPGSAPDLARWEAALLTARDGMAEVHGGDEEAYELVDDLLDRYRAWLRFLQASADSEPVSPVGAVTVVTARDALLDPMLTAAETTRVRRVPPPAPGMGLLDSPEVRSLLWAAVHRNKEE